MLRAVFILAFTIITSALGGNALADVRTTRHALTKSNRPDASDICIFCHTPVNAAAVSGSSNTNAAPPKAPLWQKSVDLRLEFNIYDDIGRVGMGRSSVGSQSFACLSCHDSNQAPIMIGPRDHPYGVPYRGATKYINKGDLPSTMPKSSQEGDTMPFTRAGNLKYVEDFRDPSQGQVEGRTSWWVSRTGITGRRSRQDLPLYNRVLLGGDDSIPYIECSSCHDPHSSNDMFLRIPNTGSQLCLTCHIK